MRPAVPAAVARSSSDAVTPATVTPARRQSVFERLSRSVTETPYVGQGGDEAENASTLAQCSLTDPVYGASALLWPGAVLIRIPFNGAVRADSLPPPHPPLSLPVVHTVPSSTGTGPVATVAAAAGNARVPRTWLDVPNAEDGESECLDEFQPV